MDSITVDEAEKLADDAESIGQLQRVMASQSIQIFRQLDFVASCQHRIDDPDLRAAIRSLFEDVVDYADAYANEIRKVGAGEGDSGKR